MKLSEYYYYNINLTLINRSFYRVRPLSKKEIKTGDDMAVQFPGEGQIHVSFFSLLSLIGNQSFKIEAQTQIIHR